MKKLLKDRSGSMYMIVVLFMALIGLVILIVTEIMRIHSIASHVETELSRAVNIAVEAAMYDSWRMDKYGELDPAVARNEFYNYLYADLGLNGSHEMHNGGDRIYRIQFTGVTTEAIPPRMEAKGTVHIRSLFSFILPETEVPFSVRSRNRRID